MDATCFLDEELLSGAKSPWFPKNLPIYYDHQKKVYLRKDIENTWIQLNESSLFRHLTVEYGIKKKKHLLKSVEYIQTNKAIWYAGPLAGYHEGERIFGNKKILVTESPVIIQPKAGSWETIRTILEGLLGVPEEQLTTLYGWLQISLQAFHSQQPRPGQALALIGPRDCGKSYLQNILTKLFGGRDGIPYQYMTGATSFNADLFAAEHLMVEDNDARTDLKSRRTFGTALKTFTVNESARCHAKGKDALTMKPIWRVTISVNDEPQNMLLMPPMDDSLQDKIILFKAKQFAFPMPTYTGEERQRLNQKIAAELPAFAHFLMEEFQIPDHLQCRRFGIVAYHHPELLAALWDQDPEMRLLTLIDRYVLQGGRTSWKGTAEQLEGILTAVPRIRFELDKILNFNNAVGTYLGKLGTKLPHRIKHVPGRADGRRQWEIFSEGTPLETVPAIDTVTAPIQAMPKTPDLIIEREIMSCLIESDRDPLDLIGEVMTKSNAGFDEVEAQIDRLLKEKRLFECGGQITSTPF